MNQFKARNTADLWIATPAILLLTNSARAGTVSSLGITDLSMRNPTFVDDPNTGIKLETQNSATIVSSNLSAAMPTFPARFAGMAAADTEKPAPSASAELLLNGFISFNITALPTESWTINVTQTRNFALTLAPDPPTDGFQSQALVNLPSASYAITPGASGSLQFPSASVEDTTATFGNVDLPINKSVTDVLTGTGSANVKLSVFERLNAISYANNGPSTVLAPGQEAAVRFGMVETLTNVSADDYPDPGGRNPLNDGHFFDVKVTFVPEPPSGVLAVFGAAAAALAFGSATARRRRPLGWIVSICSRCVLAVAAASIVAVAHLAHGAIIDFETDPFGNTPVDNAPLSRFTPYNIAGLQVSFGFDTNSDNLLDSDGLFEETGTYPGDPISAFQGSSGIDTPDPGFGPQLGNWFLQSPNPGSQFGRFVIQYTSSFPVTAASGEIWDIDGNTSAGTTEEYTIQAFDASNSLLATIVSPLGVLDTPNAPLDGEPWVFAFSGIPSPGIDHIVITFTGTKPAGIGLAFNNFNPVAAPEPSTAVLGVVGATLLACCWRVRPRRGSAGD
jgi:hypothetical protein